MNRRSLTRHSAVLAAAVGVALVTGLAAPTTASAGSLLSPDTATVNMLPTPQLDANNQFIPGTSSGVSATVNLSENGLLLTGNGTATGLNPNNQYVSLIYGLGSNSDVTLPITGRGPCVDDGQLGDVIVNTPGAVAFSPVATVRMLQGLWVGSNLVSVKATDPLTGLFLIQGKTMSIRQATLPLNPLNLFNDIRPQIFKIQACGIIVPTNGTYTAAYPPIPGT
ncbi:MAG: hypothetical protein H0V10_05085, partial [Geodermatophilaceae bacterium]|nr:hypothetical protein [Geodermatophilaceae bacterium]